MPHDDTTTLEAEAGPGAAAVLHGMLATLSEALEGLDARLAGLEQAERLGEVEARLRELTEALRAAAEVDDQPEPDPVEPVLHALTAVEARIDARVGDVAAGLADVRAAVAEALFDLAGRQSGIAEAVQAAVARELRTALAGVVDDIRLDLHTASASAVEELRNELRSAVEEIGATARAAAADLRAHGGAVAEELRTVLDLAGRRTADDVVARVGEALPVPDDDARAAEVAEAAEAMRRVLAAALEEHRVAVAEELDRARTVVRGAVAEVTGQAGSMAAAVGALEGRLTELLATVRGFPLGARSA